MPQLVYYVAMSLDGYIATPDGGVEWLAPFETAEEDYGYSAFYGSVDAILMGRRTYEQSLTFGPWPYPRKPSWVFTRGTLETPSPDVTATAQSPSDLISELRERGVRRAWLVGGAQLAASFRADHLITEYVVSVIPVILGDGIPLFAGPGPMESLQLLETVRYDNGLVQLRYVPADGTGFGPPG